MKTNVSIELTDQERCVLADMIDGKRTKRLATRAEVVAICQQHVGGLLVQEATQDYDLPKAGVNRSDLYRVDPEDEHILRGKPDGYIFGWNRVKRGAA